MKEYLTVSFKIIYIHNDNFLVFKISGHDTMTVNPSLEKGPIL